MATNQPTFRQIAKHPLVYALLILGGLVGMFAKAWLGIGSGRADDCNARVEYLQAELHHKDSVVYAQAFEIKTQKEVLRQLPAVTDSVLRTK